MFYTPFSLWFGFCGLRMLYTAGRHRLVHDYCVFPKVDTTMTDLLGAVSPLSRKRMCVHGVLRLLSLVRSDSRS
ncbi:hypothetical protein P879_04867 [Paragonimus westermani]|uniref:Uncharacterized protein n=1 Tax=Paragonimus westermani TaxID=34504 RepID=A0A8T0D2Z6_9TREM|nr:hypothetical protein P879_04867 [Paragonimus westermani]